MIILEPHSGLANRMRVIASGIAYANATGQKLVINWIADKGLGCDFSDLFEPLHESVYSSAILRIGRKAASFLDRRAPAVLKFWGTCFDDSKCRQLMWDKGTDDLQTSFIKPGGLNFIHTCNDFFLSKADLSLFKPMPVITRKVTSNRVKLGDKAIGIHIRRTDHAGSIANSPLEGFMAAISMFLDKDAETRFYLASDDKETLDLIRNRFGSSIVTSDAAFGRSSKQAIIDALTDIYTLASCEHIIGSFNSSFSAVAARIHHIPLTIIQQQCNEK